MPFRIEDAPYVLWPTISCAEPLFMNFRCHITSLLALLTVSTTIVSAADRWTVHPVFSRPVTRAVETATDVYYLAGGSLFGYDKERDERLSYTTDNLLSSSADIDNIFYDYEGDRLLIAYADGNIDLLDGASSPERVINLPDIANASTVGTARAINDVAFAGDTVYVATQFGLVMLDASRGETLASGIYPSGVEGVALTPTHIIIKHDGAVRSLPRGKRISSIADFTVMTPWSDVAEMTALSPTRLLMRRAVTSRECLMTITFPADCSRIYGSASVDNGYRSAQPLIFTPEGAVRYVADGRLYGIDADGRTSELAALHEDIASGDAIACAGSTDAIYAAGPDGFACYGYTPGSGWTVRSERVKPEALSVKSVAYIIPASDGRAYLTNLGPTNYRFGYSDEGLSTIQTTSRLDADGRFTDVSASGVEAKVDIADAQKRFGPYPVAPVRLAEDPDDPDTYWLCTGNDGLYRITSGKFAGRYDQDNAPFVPQWGCRVYDVSFDRGGNMWVASHTGDGTSGIAVLPADKRRRDPSEVTAADWYVVNIPGYSSGKDVITLHCAKTGMIFITDSNVSPVLVAIDTRGTFDDLTDDRVMVWESLTDQDGRTLAPERHSALAEDRDGRVWLGTNGGVVEITDPTRAIEPSMTVNRLKVPRRDGTNSADYLLETDLVYSIAVDHADRKWLTTDGSGVFLVSPRGDEIIASFNASNSPLPSNRVMSAYVAPLTNSVYFGSAYGLVEYESDASPALEAYDILAYPNPVRPDYSGDVTITGLMEGSLVKIADAGGHVVWQGRSEGGMCRWPVTDMGGRRVKSGIYHILASRTGMDVASPSGSVAKIAVIN